VGSFSELATKRIQTLKAKLSPGTANLVQKGYKKMSPFFIPYAITNMGGALLAIDQGLMGPNYSISTACATANYAFVMAANHIRQVGGGQGRGA
jgi:3-oxoacyl-(acyl-carrier-protein) synthase